MVGKAKAAPEIRHEDAEPVSTSRVKGAPSFRMSEGTREELARTGHAVDPFTGKTLTRDDL